MHGQVGIKQVCHHVRGEVVNLVHLPEQRDPLTDPNASGNEGQNACRNLRMKQKHNAFNSRGQAINRILENGRIFLRLDSLAASHTSKYKKLCGWTLFHRFQGLAKHGCWAPTYPFVFAAHKDTSSPLLGGVDE